MISLPGTSDITRSLVGVIIFWMTFWMDFDSVSLPTWSPKSRKIDQKSMPRWLPMLTSFLDRFFIDFCSQLGASEPEKSSPRCSESTIFQKIAFRSWHRFLIDVGANLPPFSLPKSMKILLKIDPKMHQFCDRFGDGFFIDLVSILKANLAPFCLPKSFKILSKINLERHRFFDRLLASIFYRF